jgi:putative protease
MMSTYNSKPELLLPAGNLEKLMVAYRYGADACYIGLPDFSLRYRENQVTKQDLFKAVKETRKLGKKIYVTLNTYPHNISIGKIISHIKFLRKIKPDAIIFSDPGVYRLIRQYYPEAILHLSVQATCTNYETVKFWRDRKVKRIILARELSLKEISQINRQVPDIELEVFVHGAICMAYSGRCLLSNYMTGRDANQGDCAHPCRWNYKVLEENLRKNEYFPVYENSHGSHILSSRDLCLIVHLKKIIDTKVVSLKIEGRAKNINYLATIAKSYRQAIDDVYHNRSFDRKLLREVATVSNRGFFTGFYFDKPSAKDHQLEGNRTCGTYEFIGVVRHYDEASSLATIECKGRVKLNDSIEILTPDSVYRQKVSHLYNYALQPINIYHPGLDKPFILRVNKKLPIYSIIRKKLRLTMTNN